jgi:MFS family permease
VLRWLIGLATSLIGSHIYLVTLAWAAVQTTTPANVGLILVAGSIPQAALLLIGGVFVDRLGPKPTIIASDVLRTAIMVVFAVVVSGGDVSPLLLGALAVLFGVVDGFFLPAVSTAPRYLVPRDSLTRVVAAKTIVARGAEFAGAPLGSWLLVVASAAVAFWVNAGLFAVSVVMLALTRMAQPQAPHDDALPDAKRSPTAPEMSVWADLVAGVRLIRGYRTLAMLLIIVFVAELGFSGPMMAGVPLLAHQTGWGVRAVGWILGGFGLGAAAAAGFLLWRNNNLRHTGVAALSGLTVMGLSVVGLGLLPALGLSVSAAYVSAGFLGLMSGIGAGFYGTLVTTAVLRLAPTGQIGRVMSALSFASLSAVPLTYALTGLITGVTAAQVPFFIGGSLVLLAAAIALANPQLRHLRMDATDPAEQGSDRTINTRARR